ncbi:uncharacterized protein BX663DRAFT_501203 [Cokeromyces recurvatus]|uniref:uncharacterized protein n=1 Tax=Cokeromyces recurvatus TaxID=90255 RepID=UPI00221E80C2|nr:uncharacterized protein BX663DRAFT_501203 [Cokeromyces recurvatus]KAI7904969.1 hypothetical protein BX663DRAFT_501203 [Cokeromyces recurvatus]
MSKPPTILFKKLVNLYKVSRFPWKKHALIGFDLQGNEYWDCPNPLGGRPKRWVQMVDGTENDLTVFHQNKLPVQWQSWLRHTRNIAPTLEELVLEERRRAIIQGRVKTLEQEREQRKLELQKINEIESKELERLSVIKEEANDKKEQQTSNSTQPTGQGDTFSPGEWNPVSSRR